MKILVSHEMPISLLTPEIAYKICDFDYALVHLFEEYPKYYQYFYNARHYHNREVLLDNSIFELGKAFDMEKFKFWIEELQPSCYVIPDALEDADKTIIQCYTWLDIHAKSGHASTARKIGVVQGKTFAELVKCYRTLSQLVDEIAISFDYSYYKVTGIGETPLELNMTGRQRFIASLIDEGIWNWRIPVHLLGCSLAREFTWYVDRNICNIRSCDTSNPIVAAIENQKYDGDFGLKTKSQTKLADNIGYVFTPDQMDLVHYNTSQFKRILKRD